MALSKAEVNEHFYSTVGGQIEFETEAQGFLHPLAVGRLLAAYARATGKKALKILELGANNGAFAISLLKMLTVLAVNAEVDLDLLDYFGVDYARSSLETFFGSEEKGSDFQRATRGAMGAALVGTLARLGKPESRLHLVHADAERFMRGGKGGFDLIVMNELLDDLPGHAFFADAEGRKHELTAQAAEVDGRWRVTVSAEETSEPGLEDMPPSTVAVRSPEAVAVIRGAAEQLESGGLLLVHDYGVVTRYAPLADYEPAPASVPEFVDLEFPPGSESGFPRRFFRLFANDDARVVQITSDVGFAELIDVLEPLGTVITLPHGNALLRSRTPECDDLRKGDGIFLSEFATLGPGDDAEALLRRLESTQEELRRRFVEQFVEGSSVFADLIFIKR